MENNLSLALFRHTILFCIQRKNDHRVTSVRGTPCSEDPLNCHLYFLCPQCISIVRNGMHALHVVEDVSLYIFNPSMPKSSFSVLSLSMSETLPYQVIPLLVLGFYLLFLTSSTLYGRFFQILQLSSNTSTQLDHYSMNHNVPLFLCCQA